MIAFPTVASIFLLLLLGYAAKRFGVLKIQDTAVVNSIILNLTAPAFIFTAIYGKFLTLDMLGAPLMMFLSTVAVLGLAYLTAKALKFDKKTTAGFMLVSAFGNTGFLGYPITIAAFPNQPEAITTAVIVDQFAMAVPLYTIGIAIVASLTASDSGKWQPLAFLRSPMLIAVLVAIALRNVPLPGPLINSLDILAAATVPLAMISLGLSLSRMSFKSATSASIAAFILKMVALPALAFIGLRLLGIHGVVRDVTVIEAAMPPAILNSIIAARYDANREFVSGATFIMTLASLITIPIILTLLR